VALKETSPSKTIVTNVAEIWLDTYSILCVRILEGAEMDELGFKSCFDAYRKLLHPDRKYQQLIDGRALCNITREGKQYSAQQSPDLFTATALITDNLSVRLLVSFFNKEHRHSVPFKLFRSEEEARTWLCSHKAC
jgi:hypothetical protein